MIEQIATAEELEAALAWVDQSPRDAGLLEMIVARPAVGERVVLATGELNQAVGLVGDNWLTRGSKRTENGEAHQEQQVLLMNARAIQALTQDRERWPLAGDQLYVDLDLSPENLPAGHQLLIGTAILEVTPMPHTGCDKFTARFGHAAIRWVNSPEGRRRCLRGICAKVVQPGIIQAGDTITVQRPVL